MPELPSDPAAGPPPLGPFRVGRYLQYRAWGGSRFPSEDGQPIGEAWLVDDRCAVEDGPRAGALLRDLTAELGPRLLGSAATDRSAGHFPLRVKILDPADWLSVQVHPDGAVARRRHGPDAVGKDEAWVVLEAPAGATLVAGLRPGTGRDALEASFGTPAIGDLLERLPVSNGDAITVPAGLVHAVAPGICVYEIQESSDLTYRMYDWDRPAGLGRSLDREASLAAIRLEARPHLGRVPSAAGTLVPVASTDAFLLRAFRTTAAVRVELDVDGRSVVVLTVAEGQVDVESEWGGGTRARDHLSQHETLVLPAGLGRVTVSSSDEALLLAASLV